MYGYDKTAGDYFDLAVNQKEAEVVRRIYGWYVKDGYGTAKISGFLNQQGLRTKRGCRWSQNAVCRILTNQLYTGRIINGRQEIADFLTGRREEKDPSEWMVADRPHLRIIDPEIFARAEEIMRSRGKAFRTRGERQSNRHLFSTLLRCGECGSSFRRTVRTYRNTYVRWVCSGHNGKGAASCPNAAAVDEGELAAVLQEYFAGLLRMQKKTFGQAAEELGRMCRARETDSGEEREAAARLVRLQKSRQKYLDLYADDLISRRELNEKINGMREEMERLEKEQSRFCRRQDGKKQLESVLNQLFAGWEDMADVRQMTNAQLRQIIRKIEVDKEGNVDIYLCRLEAP